MKNLMFILLITTAIMAQEETEIGKVQKEILVLEKQLKLENSHHPELKTYMESRIKELKQTERDLTVGKAKVEPEDQGLALTALIIVGLVLMMSL